MAINFFEVNEIQVTYKRRFSEADATVIKNDEQAVKLFREAMENHIDHKEGFYAILLTTNMQVLGIQKISEGGITGTVVDQRILFGAMLKANAVSAIIAHNHPSGNLKPSQADRELTEKIKKSGKILDLDILDHLIITTEDYARV
tara:strand:+ start:242 stop:676 length:435 start_codon:yes stop_codon:yes gene_type:complete